MRNSIEPGNFGQKFNRYGIFFCFSLARKHFDGLSVFKPFIEAYSGPVGESFRPAVALSGIYNAPCHRSLAFGFLFVWSPFFLYFNVPLPLQTSQQMAWVFSQLVLRLTAAANPDLLMRGGRNGLPLGPIPIEKCDESRSITDRL